MECPRCRNIEVKEDVPILGRASTCETCGWLQITTLTLEAGLTTYERMKREESLRLARSPRADRRMDSCVLCDKSRTQLETAGVRLILGVNGGVCTNCIGLCQSVIDEAEAKVNAIVS